MSPSAKLYHVSCHDRTIEVMARTAEDAVASGKALLEAEDEFPVELLELGTGWAAVEAQIDEDIFDLPALDSDSYPVAGSVEKLVASITGGGAS